MIQNVVITEFNLLLHYFPGEIGEKNVIKLQDGRCLDRRLNIGFP